MFEGNSGSNCLLTWGERRRKDLDVMSASITSLQALKEIMGKCDLSFLEKTFA